MITSPAGKIYELRLELNKNLRLYSEASARVKTETAELSAASKLIQDTAQAQQVLQDLAQLLQQRAHTQIARVVTRCLVAVFDKPYELRILFEQRAGSTVAKLVYYEGEYEIIPRTTSGGILDVASMALRLIVLVLSMQEPILIMDEPFKMLDSINMPRVATLLQTLSQEMGVQFIIVTHSEALCVGKIVRFS